MAFVGVLSVVPIVAVLVLRTLGMVPHADDLWLVAGVAFGAAALVGVPAVQWAIEHGRTRVVHLMAIGALSGAVVPLLALISGVAGQLAHGGGDYTRWILAHGATLPWYGSMRWGSFAAFVGECAAIGAMSLAVVTPVLPASTSDS